MSKLLCFFEYVVSRTNDNVDLLLISLDNVKYKPSFRRVIKYDALFLVLLWMFKLVFSENTVVFEDIWIFAGSGIIEIF